MNSTFYEFIKHLGSRKKVETILPAVILSVFGFRSDTKQLYRFNPFKQIFDIAVLDVLNGVEKFFGHGADAAVTNG